MAKQTSSFSSLLIGIGLVLVTIAVIFFVFSSLLDLSAIVPSTLMRYGFVAIIIGFLIFACSGTLRMKN